MQEFYRAHFGSPALDSSSFLKVVRDSTIRPDVDTLRHQHSIESSQASADPYSSPLNCSMSRVHQSALRRRLQTSDHAINYYHMPGCELRFTPPCRPIRVAFLTSVRDVGAEEHVGRTINVVGNRIYVKGCLQHVVECANEGDLYGYAHIVAVINDDCRGDMSKGGYPLKPRRGRPWIHPRTLKNSSGDLLTDITYNIPSKFRRLPSGDHVGRKESKLEFEKAIWEIIRQARADIVVSDHFMCKIEYLIDPSQMGLFGKVLNIHPGITRLDHPRPCRGAEPDEEALLHARGLVIDPKTQALVISEPYYYTGASFHMVSPDIDVGPVICDSEATRVSKRDSNETLTLRNYRRSKNPVVVAGLRHYISHMLPNLATLDTTKFTLIKPTSS